MFPSDADLPADELNTTIDEHFVPLGQPSTPAPGQFNEWKEGLLDGIRRVSFGYFPETIPPANVLGEAEASNERVESEEGIEFRLRFATNREVVPDKKSLLLVVLNEEEAGTVPDWIEQIADADQAIVLCEPRGIGATKWTTKNPPNYVERSHVLLGRTVDTGRVWDIIAAAQAVSTEPEDPKETTPVHVAGRGAAGLIAAYAAVLDERIVGVTLVSPPTTHMQNTAPQFLNVLRACDVPDVLGLLAPRPLTLIGADPSKFARSTAAYAAAGAQERLSIEGQLTR